MLPHLILLRDCKTDHRLWDSTRLLMSFFVWLSVGILSANSEESPGEATSNDPHGAERRMVDLRPCSFQNVTPGETGVDDALQRLGKPAEDSQDSGIRTLIYHLEPFEKVEVVVAGGMVESVVLHFKTPATPRQIEQELQLTEIEPTPVKDVEGLLLGRAYPERGVLVNFDPESTAHRATQLVLEPITADLFLLRVRNDTRHQYRRKLSDLRIAKQLDGTNLETLQLLAETLAEAGETKQALETVSQALDVAPGTPRFALLKAQLLTRLDRHDEAIELVRGILEDSPQDAEVHGPAEKLLGDLLTQGASRDFAAAIEHHLAAIKIVAPLASDKREAVRLAAKEILIEAFLAAAFDIAAGEWQDQEITTAKWLASAKELSDATIASDRGDTLWRLRVTLGSLAAYAELSSTDAVEPWLTQLNREAQRLEGASGDPLFKRELQVLRVRGLFDAATIAHRRDRKSQARELATQAVRLIEEVADSRELTPSEKYQFGRLYFFMGSTTAVADRNHAEAIKWYAQARKYLGSKPPAFAALDLGRHGERQVSMGASYFEAGQRELGLKLTRDGLETMQSAAEMGVADPKSLVLPYNNLAAMYKLVGKSEEARELSEIASRIDTEKKAQPR